jgi:hypothetical protein
MGKTVDLVFSMYTHLSAPDAVEKHGMVQFRHHYTSDVELACTSTPVQVHVCHSSAI